MTEEEAAQAFAGCMREHGIEDLQDPTAGDHWGVLRTRAPDISNPLFFGLRCLFATRGPSTDACRADQTAGDGSEAARDLDPDVLKPPRGAESPSVAA